jgi:palmitoyltransferase ZDHHC4
VSKYDHHCVWIRQCVGEKNYKYFVSFLGLHAIWCLYLSNIGALSLLAFIERINFYDLKFNMDGQVRQADGLLALQVLPDRFSICS